MKCERGIEENREKQRKREQGKIMEGEKKRKMGGKRWRGKGKERKSEKDGGRRGEGVRKER